MYILLRTCGGLGNQLFQSLFALSLSSQNGSKIIYHYHSTKYKRYAPQEIELALFKPPTIVMKFIMSLRLPKILYRLGISKKEFFTLGPFVLVDGYFLSSHSYKDLNTSKIASSLDMLKLLYAESCRILNGKLIHLRLGDFFHNSFEENRYLESVLLNRTEVFDVITNKDEVVEAFLNENKLNNYNHIKSKHLSSKELINLVSSYSNVEYNGSTLIFWASIFSGSKIEQINSSFNNKYIISNYTLLKDMENLLRNC